MGHTKSRQDLRQQVKAAYAACEAFGESRHAGKADGTAAGKIYSYDTARAYNKIGQAFITYCVEERGADKRCTLEDVRCYGRDYVSQLKAADGSAASPYTTKQAAAALAKLYGSTGRGEFVLPDQTRRRADITRGRERYVISEKTGKEILNPHSRAGHFSESRNHEIVDFARSIGTRRSELAQMRGTDLRERDGQFCVRIEGKGGRVRYAPVIGSEERVKAVVERMRDAGSGKVWDKIPAHMDVHRYRRQYASSMYKSLAREDIPKPDQYHCRRDLKGVTYDKTAMLEVSHALGHGRISVIASHYLEVSDE